MERIAFLHQVKAEGTTAVAGNISKLQELAKVAKQTKEKSTYEVERDRAAELRKPYVPNPVIAKYHADLAAKEKAAEKVKRDAEKSVADAQAVKWAKLEAERAKDQARREKQAKVDQAKRAKDEAARERTLSPADKAYAATEKAKADKAAKTEAARIASNIAAYGGGKDPRIAAANKAFGERSQPKPERPKSKSERLKARSEGLKKMAEHKVKLKAKKQQIKENEVKQAKLEKQAKAARNRAFHGKANALELEARELFKQRHNVLRVELSALEREGKKIPIY